MAAQVPAMSPFLEAMMRSLGPVARDLTSSLLSGTGEAATTDGYQRSLSLIRTMLAAHSNQAGGTGGAGGLPADLDSELLSMFGIHGGANGQPSEVDDLGDRQVQLQPGPVFMMHEGEGEAGMGLAAVAAARRVRPRVTDAVVEQQRMQASSHSQQVGSSGSVVHNVHLVGTFSYTL